MALRNIPDPGFAGDDGTADAELADALARYAEDPAGARDGVLAALAGARLLVPVVAVLGESEDGPAGLKQEKTSDMAVPTLRAPGGRVALPAFTSVTALSRWRRDARPVAVHVRQALESAYQEQADTLVLDVAGPVPFQLTGAPLRALAEGRTPLPPSEDPEIAQAIHEVLCEQPGVRRAHLLPAASPAADATLALVLTENAPVAETAHEVATTLSTHPLLRTRLDHGLELALLPPSTALPGRASLCYDSASGPS